MGFMQRLCEAYDVGIKCEQSNEETQLAREGFKYEKITYYITLTKDGEFVSANYYPDVANKMSMIPTTLEAESRTGSVGMPYPLADQLKYLVNEDDTSEKRYEKYSANLEEWCKYGAPECIQAVHKYIEGKADKKNRTLLSELKSSCPDVKYYTDEKRKSGEGNSQKKFVTFFVQMDDDNPDDLLKRDDVKQSWMQFYASKYNNPSENKGLCCITGEVLTLTTKYPKIKGNAKLISSKDDEFWGRYTGRFLDNKAAMVSNEAVVKSHNALRWLINRQGINRYGMTWLVWNTDKAIMEKPYIISEEDEEDEEYNQKPAIDTYKDYADDVNKAIKGYGCELDEYDKDLEVIILGLEANDGRLSVTYYQECKGGEYVKRIREWYMDCCWWKNRFGDKPRIASPCPVDIVTAMMGTDFVKTAKADKKYQCSQAKFMKRLSYWIQVCIVEGKNLQFSMVQSAFNRVCKPMSFKNKTNQKWSRSKWQTSVNTTCAMIMCYKKRSKETGYFEPELNKETHNRDYLFGRLLAIADYIEYNDETKKKGYATSAIRMTQLFVQRPVETWKKIHDKLIPSFLSAGGKNVKYRIELEQIETMFLDEDRFVDKPLSMEFLQGYSSQWQSLFEKKPETKEENDTQDGEKLKNTVESETGDIIGSEETADKEKTKEKVDFCISNRRSELYGYLLAIADRVEIEGGGDERTGKTNAIQMMQTFSARPYECWGILHDRIIPYFEKIGSSADYYQNLIGKVETSFSQSDRESLEPLDGGYLHGYYAMLNSFYQKNKRVNYIPSTKKWDKEPKDSRSALYGRLLGLGDRLERGAFIIHLYGTEENIEKRLTNEVRYMPVFAQKPKVTWDNLMIKIQTYQRNPDRFVRIKEKIEQITEELQQADLNTNEPLNSIYLHYYYAARNKE